MKLLRKDSHDLEFELRHEEALCLRAILQQFPVTALAPAAISREGAGDKDTERAEFLNDSLVAHRRELKHKAIEFLAAERLISEGDGCRLRVSQEEREFILQLLNQIRVGSWRALGEPADLEAYAAANPPRKSPDYLTLMDLTGFFEHHLLDAGLED